MAYAGNRVAKEHGSLRVAIVPKAPTVRDDLHLEITGDGNVTSCGWENNGKTIEGEDGVSLPRGNCRKGDLISVFVKVRGQVAKTSVTIADSPPKIITVRYQPPDFYCGVDITAQPQAEDADGDTIQFRYLWIINGEERSWENSATLKGDQFHRGDRISLQVTPFDGEREGKTYRTGSITVPDAPPHFVTTPPPVTKTRTYVYNARAEDPDGDTLTYSLVSGPSGMIVDTRTGRAIWKIGADQLGRQRAEIEARDEFGLSARQEISFDIHMIR